MYPLPFIDRISTEKHPGRGKPFTLRMKLCVVMVLPEIGGRNSRRARQSDLITKMELIPAV